jgi:co-chaperonin GroES (HSP10)
MPLTAKPIGKRVLLEEKPKKLANGLVLADSSKERAWYDYTVVAVGEDSAPVKVGDSVMFNPDHARYCGPPALFGGRTLIVLDIEGILAVFSGEMDPLPPAIVTAKPLIH